MQAMPFGRYVLLQKLAQGGTAEIFKAKLLGVEGFEKEVAIKRILPPWSANPHFISMLIDEAKILVKLQDDRIVQVFELGREEGLYYISMEYVRGWDLRHLQRQAQEGARPFQIAETAHLISEILRGLDYIHQQCDAKGRNLEIVHRDISPQNILLSTEGRIKIADFGIAHARSRSHETSTGVIKGKFSYMSPEQARGDALNLKTDLFACGILFYELLTSQKLFQGKSDLELLEKVRNFETEKALQNLKLPKALLPILRRALSALPSHRYSSAREFLGDLREACEALGIRGGEALLLKRLKDMPALDKEEESQDLSFKQGLKTHSQAIVSRKWDSDTALEITRSLESAPQADTDRKPLPAPPPKRSRRGLFGGLAGGLLALLLLSFWLGSAPPPAPGAAQPETQASLFIPPLPSPPAESSAASESQALSPPLSSMALPARVPKPTPEKGLLSIRALPWGKISVSGVANNAEKPLLRSLAYGNYSVKVAYQNEDGQWSSVSQSVRVAKPSTQCSAIFQRDGRGTLRCQ